VVCKEVDVEACNKTTVEVEVACEEVEEDKTWVVE
jgi:hypothetical protein